MKRALPFCLLAILALGTGACQKQQTEAERNAEIERQVKRRLHAGADANTRMDSVRLR